MQQQKGFVLVSVLIITTISTMLAFSQLSENRLQERIAGNQQKEISARLAAEKGLFDAFEFIASENAAGTSNAAIFNALSASSFSEGDNYSLEQLDLSGTNFEFVSKGSFQGAVSYLKSSIEAIEESGSSVFTDAVAGCDGVYVGNGGGRVDSYDSSIAEYDANNANANGSVSTISSGADIELSGSGSIYGNLISNGDITTGTSSGSSITGVMTAAGNIQLKGITSTGNIHTGGDFDFSGLNATGQEITVGGDLLGGNGNNDITSSVVYGGENTSSLTTAVKSDDIQPPVIDLGICDPLDIITEMSGIAAQVISTGSATHSFASTMTGETLAFNGSAAYSDDAIVAGVSPVMLDVFGKEKAVYIFDAFNTNTQTVTITGDITLLIKGDITTAKTQFIFPVGDTTSSLTILTEEKVGLGSLTDLFPGTTVNSEGEAPLTIYSSYVSNDASDIAITVGSNADMYARLYAPSGNLDLGGGGEIMGAVRGKEVNISAGTGIHYDEILADLIDIKDEDSAVTSYSSVYYYYPDE